MRQLRTSLVYGCFVAALLSAPAVGGADPRGAAPDLSPCQLMDLAYQYAWHEDSETERALLEEAATRPASPQLTPRPSIA